MHGLGLTLVDEPLDALLEVEMVFAVGKVEDSRTGILILGVGSAAVLMQLSVLPEAESGASAGVVDGIWS
ncbi:hypothetical protein WICPIJ_007667 [Wickerhamomyces pijperi]|uniref:Uncharacterized protein n=1 Tax=Wickerhamomyces pijperi TaxID=599730 RepID=A0A9P8PZV5_WICPI|nr:hypothetical protein WICPIJ_007667 [Wickerhamomyces pijperi]